jgi:hypothetical protein
VAALEMRFLGGLNLMWKHAPVTVPAVKKQMEDIDDDCDSSSGI